MSEYNRDQIKRKLKNSLKVFRTAENTHIIDLMIDETLDTIGFNIIGKSTINELRDSFFQQNFTCWDNVLLLNWNKKYF